MSAANETSTAADPLSSHGLILTRHAAARIRQRGFRESDFDVLVQFGEEFLDGTLMLTDDAVQSAIAEKKKEIAQLERLRGMKAPIKNGNILTVYKTPKHKIPCRRKSRG